eukprot:CAMPEP_0194065028 /NCGR_PEP_ID=MMETSP0009_2-20130614/84630_1 /TAXON_ID=210454 /ORGANISM="Grammatophora oceanica, Strain CCMP 410" /LENGTH=88 /DNA_ID=CAMNT_0038717743 /DNA_START=108 /DNA_END=371 /DNA_ORIENTATION=+
MQNRPNVKAVDRKNDSLDKRLSKLQAFAMTPPGIQQVQRMAVLVIENPSDGGARGTGWKNPPLSQKFVSTRTSPSDKSRPEQRIKHMS